MALDSCRHSVAADGTVVLSLCENERCTTKLLSAEQAQLLNQHAGHYLSVQPGWIDNFILNAQQHTGTLVFENLHIHIEPKIPVDNLFYMLTYAYDLPRFRSDSAPLAVSADIFSFVVTIFLQHVQSLVRRGIYRAYVDYTDDPRHLRGRILLTQQLQKQPAVATRFHQHLNDYTADILENRILKYTLWLLSRVPQLDQQRLALRRSLSAFSDVTLTSLTPANCDQVVYQRLNIGYHTPIHLAQLLLQNLSVEGHAGSTSFATFMLPMYQVFELFIARYLDHELAGHPRLSVDIQPDIWLDEQQIDKGKPDIILRIDGLPFLVIDTKYKAFADKPQPADRNQMLVYCQTLGLQHGLLLYADSDPVTFNRRFTGVTLLANALDLSGELRFFQQRCDSFVKGIIESEVFLSLGVRRTIAT